MDNGKQGSAGSAVSTGLRGVVAASSSIGDVNGEKGELIYQGINIHDLATSAWRFEQDPHDVVDVAEVALDEAQVIKVDGRAFVDRLGEDVR